MMLDSLVIDLYVSCALITEAIHVRRNVLAESQSSTWNSWLNERLDQEAAAPSMQIFERRTQPAIT